MRSMQKKIVFLAFLVVATFAALPHVVADDPITQDGTLTTYAGASCVTTTSGGQPVPCITEPYGCQSTTTFHCGAPFDVNVVLINVHRKHNSGTCQNGGTEMCYSYAPFWCAQAHSYIDPNTTGMCTLENQRCEKFWGNPNGCAP